MDFNTEHCGKAWPHNGHSWLPGYRAFWVVCPGSDEQGKRPLPSVRSVELKAKEGE